MFLLDFQENNALWLVNGFARNPRENFGNFVKISKSFRFFGFCPFLAELCNQTWGVIFGGGEKTGKPVNFMVYRGSRKSIGFFSEKVGKFSAPFSESLNIIEKRHGFLNGAQACQTRFFAENVGVDFRSVGFSAEIGEKS